jgi:hypothetical protein
MPKYVVSYDILLPGILEVEAPDERAAIDAVYDTDPHELLKLANTSDPDILESSVHVEDESP